MRDSGDRLAVVLAVRYFMNVGGMEKFSLSLAAFLRDRGHNVKVVAIRGQPMEGVSLRIAGKPRPVPRFMRDWYTGSILARTVKEERADVVLGEQKMWNCDVLRPAGGVEDEYWKAHVRFRRILPFPPWTRFLAFKRILDLRAERLGYRDPRLRCVIANSNLVRKQLLRHYPHLEGRIRVIHEGVASDLRVPDASGMRRHILRSHGLAEDGVTAIFVGHDFRRKGVPQAMQAVAEARRREPCFRLQLLILGRDRSLYCRRLARRLGIENAVAFAGSVSPPDPYFLAADFLMLPTFYDPFANVTVEALAAGLPVLTTRQNGGAEILTHGTDGWVVDDPGDIRGMAECLLRMRDPTRLSAMKASASALAAGHSIQAALESVEQALIEVAGEKKRDRELGTPRPIK